MDTKKENIKVFDQHLDKKNVIINSVEKTEFDIKSLSFAIGKLMKEERKLAKMTQAQIAVKIGAKKSFISRVENGHSDIQLSTLYKLIEIGVGRKITITIQ